MKLLLTGANGQVGWSVRNQVQTQADTGAGSIQLVATDITGADVEVLNIAELSELAAFCDQHKPDLVLNAAAYTAVDQAEQDRNLAYKVNAQGPENLARVCTQRGIPLLHISTDYVYDGTKASAYVETDPIAPQSVYGHTKAQGDEFVSASGCPFVILRTAWVYSAHGNNFVKTMLRLARERDEINVVADQQGNPTSAADIAAALLEITSLLNQGSAMPSGIFHYTGQGATSWYDFTNEIFRQAKQLDLISRIPQVNPITTDQYPTPAKRPANSVLDCTKISQNLPTVKLPNWQDSLNQVLKELKAGAA
jgi:dTDP-4-dehydrorhamnose reductase